MGGGQGTVTKYKCVVHTLCMISPTASCLQSASGSIAFPRPPALAHALLLEHARMSDPT